MDFASKIIKQLYPLLTEEDIIKVMIYRLPKENNEYMSEVAVGCKSFIEFKSLRYLWGSER